MFIKLTSALVNHKPIFVNSALIFALREYHDTNGAYTQIFSKGSNSFDVDETPEKIIKLIDGIVEEDATPIKNPIPILDMLIDELEITVRLRNCLFMAGLKTVGDIVNMPLHKLRKIRNFGVVTLHELVEELGRFGVDLNTQL